MKIVEKQVYFHKCIRLTFDLFCQNWPSFRSILQKGHFIKRGYEQNWIHPNQEFFYLVLDFSKGQCSFSGWGQFLQSFCRSTSAYKSYHKWQSHEWYDICTSMVWEKGILPSWLLENFIFLHSMLCRSRRKNMIPTSPQMRISSITYVKSEFQTMPLLWLIHHHIIISPSYLLYCNSIFYMK